MVSSMNELHCLQYVREVVLELPLLSVMVCGQLSGVCVKFSLRLAVVGTDLAADAQLLSKLQNRLQQ